MPVRGFHRELSAAIEWMLFAHVDWENHGFHIAMLVDAWNSVCIVVFRVGAKCHEFFHDIFLCLSGNTIISINIIADHFFDGDFPPIVGVIPDAIIVNDDPIFHNHTAFWSYDVFCVQLVILSSLCSFRKERATFILRQMTYCLQADILPACAGSR
jgi:hypothetical protein